MTEIVEYRPELHDRPHWDADSDDGEGLDLDAARPGTREALELLQPLLDGEVESATASGPHAQDALALVRGAARRQGLEPGGEERQALADQAADLRERGMNYREIGGELGLSPSSASGLLREYHPQVVKGCRRDAVRTQH